MFIRPWEKFRKDHLIKLFSEKKNVLDIGGGLRVDESRNNRKNENSWLQPYLDNVNYQILDKVPDHNPDIVGDIHDLPFEDNSQDAIICFAVLEHVEEPQKAVREMYRVLKPGGYCYIYVPFLFYYHPMPGYYKDFYRFTIDGLEYMTRDFSEIETQNVRGSISTALNMFPFLSKKTRKFDFVDKWLGKINSNQTSGYDVFCVK